MNYIVHVKEGDNIITEQHQKEEVFTSEFRNRMGKYQARDFTLDLDYLEMEVVGLHELDAIFTEEEIWNVIKDLPADRAPGPDGFIGMFYQKAWPIIKHDIMAAIMKL